MTFKREISTEALPFVAGKPIELPKAPVQVTPDPTQPFSPTAAPGADPTAATPEPAR